jgi:hypothetical protein
VVHGEASAFPLLDKLMGGNLGGREHWEYRKSLAKELVLPSVEDDGLQDCFNSKRVIVRSVFRFHLASH